MVALPVGSHFSLLFLWHLSVFVGIMVAGKNSSLSDCTNAVAPAIDLARRQCPFTHGSVFNWRIFHPGQSAPNAHSNPEGVESRPGLFACRDIRSLCEYE